MFNDWVEGGMQKGNNPNVKTEPPKFEKPPDAIPAGGVQVHEGTRLTSSLHHHSAPGALMRVPLAFALIVSGLVLASCSSAKTDAPRLTELQRTRSGDLEVVLLASGDALPAGKSQPTLEFQTGADRHLVDVGAVKAGATMAMPGMSPMLGTVSVAKTDTPGRYRLDADLGMTGTWRLTIEWDGPAGTGSATFPGTVR